MALTVKSIDEETTELADIYDSLIAPKKIYRNHNNKLYLILRAFGAGKIGLMDAALALHNKFDPLYCDDVDLYSTAKLVGTDFKKGSGSIVHITILNNSESQITFLAGTYNYRSVMGMTFSFQVSNDRLFEPEEEMTVAAISAEKGSFAVAKNANIKLYRSDSGEINSAFAFSCEDNSGQLGYEDETPYDFRVRILNDADRQDHIKELELKIRNLPSIFECNLVFNEDIQPHEYDGITLAGKELLITITGVPTDELARITAEEVLYATHKVEPNNVVYYYNDLFLGGKYPVYFRYHETTNFSLIIMYQYDKEKLKPVQIEDAVSLLFKPYTRMVTHFDTFSEEDAYKVLSNFKLPNVKVLDVKVLDGNGKEVSFIRVPKTRLPHLTDVTFTSIETGSLI